MQKVVKAAACKKIDRVSDDSWLSLQARLSKEEEDAMTLNVERPPLSMGAKQSRLGLGFNHSESRVESLSKAGEVCPAQGRLPGRTHARAASSLDAFTTKQQPDDRAGGRWH